MHPLDQMMEIADRDRFLNRASETAHKLARIINDERWQVVFGFRSGYAKVPGQPSLRLTVEQVAGHYTTPTDASRDSNFTTNAHRMR